MAVRLLVVDDERMIVRGLRHIIEGLEIPEVDSVHTTTSPREALRIAREISPDVVLTDVKMPELSGLELIQRMRSDGAPFAQYIVISGYDEFKLVREALHLQAIDYLLKPAKTADLRHAIEAAVHRSLEQREKQQKSSDVQTDLRRSFLLELLAFLSSERAAGCDTIQRTRKVLRRHAPVADLICGFVDTRADDDAIERYLVQAAGEVGSDRIIVATRLVGPRTLAFIAAEVGAFPGDPLGEFQTRLRDLLSSKTLDTPRSHAVSLSSRSGDMVTLDRLYTEAKKTRALKLLSQESLITWRPLENKLSEAVLSRQLVDLLQSVRMRRSQTAEAVVDEMLDEERLLDLGAGATVRIVEALEEALAGLREEVDLGSCFTCDELRRTVKARLTSAIAMSPAGPAAETLEQRVEAFALQNLNQKLGLQAAADHVGLSYAYFSSLFKETVGTSFSDFVLQLRMQEARRLLEYPDLSVEEVGSRVGYKSPKHFSRVFRSYFGIRPSELKRR